MKRAYWVYILKCADGSFYTGVSNDLDRRMDEHSESDFLNEYTRTRKPLTLVYYKEFEDIKEAIVREKQIKTWRRAKKQALIEGKVKELHLLAKRYSKTCP